MADVTKINGYIIKDANAPHPSNAGSAGQILKKTETGTEWADASFKPAGKSYLIFSSPNSFTLKVNDTTKHWDGTLEYFSSNRTWTTWDGTTTLSAVADDGEYVLYLRGTGNTVITGNDYNYRWVFTGSDISCIGNIENLLDYSTVESGNHPTMANFCCYYMFGDCTALTQAPDLPAITLVADCYHSMFSGCTSLTQAPVLPATTLVDFCYLYMFSGCTSLTQPPALPATTLANNCYQYMFQGCTSLTQAPALPATTLAKNCYRSMFKGCTSLTQAPALPATTLATYCYAYMFQGCTSLTKAPALPATMMVNSCYFCMFQGCTSLKLSSSKTGEYTQEYRIPSSGTGTTEPNALGDMFTSTGGTFTGTPEINTTYYLSSDNIVVRDTEIATLNGYVGSMIKDKLDKTGNGTSVKAEFMAAPSRINLATGDSLGALFGKIAKWLSDLGSLAFKSTVAKTDLASDVQTSLGKADSALQSVTKSDVGLGNVDNVKQYSTSNPPPYPVTSVNGQTGDVEIQSGSEAEAYTATLTTSGWAQSGSRYAQTVNVTGVTALTPVVMVDVALSGTDLNADAAALEAWGIVSANNVAQGARKLTFYALSVPSVNIPVNVGVC